MMVGKLLCRVCLPIFFSIAFSFPVFSIEGNSTTLFPCANDIFCHGDLLEAVQMARLFNDSKTFVDMRMAYNPEVVVKAFKAFGPNPNKSTLQNFVNHKFHLPGKDLAVWIPSDWKQSPSFIAKVTDQHLREFASALNSLWKKLGRNINEEARAFPNRSSLIVVSKPFIVPGGRFREYYYWDTFWTVEGLLVCEMYNTVRFMIDNFVELVKTFGFVPNGGRIYYLNRSQPPFLIPIVELYLEATGDFDFVRTILSELEIEHDFWDTHRVVEINTTGKVYRLNRYAANMNTPRPESYYEDVQTARSLKGKAKRDLYQDLASAAESGWDFSSRWFNKSSPDLKSIRTRRIVPVDLNAILYRNELTLERLFNKAGDDVKANKFKQLAAERLTAMESVFWNEDKAAWLDFDLDTMTANSAEFYACSIVPLWAGVHHGNVTRDELVVHTLRKLKVLDRRFPGGMPTSLVNSGQQWDFPNAWAPLQYMAQVGMANSKNENIQEIALQLAQDWINTNYKAWNSTKRMFEKYDARVQGTPGGGGEYDIQVGFGWTNGVALHLLKRYPSQLKVRPEPAISKGSAVDTSIGLLFIGLVTVASGLV